MSQKFETFVLSFCVCERFCIFVSSSPLGVWHTLHADFCTEVGDNCYTAKSRRREYSLNFFKLFRYTYIYTHTHSIFGFHAERRQRERREAVEVECVLGVIVDVSLANVSVDSIVSH